MKRLRCSLGKAAAGSVAAVLAVGLLSACDASPYAATVNGSTISQAAFNTELRWAAASTDYTAALTSIYSQLYSVQLTVAGDTSHSYSSGWTAYTLAQAIQGQAVRQAVAATGRAPSNDLYSAALGGIEIENRGVTGASGQGGITQMAPAYLVDVTQRLADHAQLETALPVTQLQNLYGTYRVNFYSQVCVRQASVSVQGTGGQVDFSASATQAATVARQLAGPGGTAGGSSTCYTHEQLDAQSASFINTVIKLAPGQATIQRTGYGYQVTAVSSRQLQPLNGAVAQVLTTLAYDLESPASDTVLRGLEARTKIRVNPVFGSWQPGSSTSLASVIAPSAPAATPVGSSGSLTASSLGGSLGS